MTEMLKEILEQPKVLTGIEKANEKTLKALVSELAMRGTGHVMFSARGTSDHAGIYGQYVLGIYQGAVASLAIPSCITLYDGKLILSNDLVMGISQSGKAADALAVIERANEQGALTAAITNDPDSHLAKAAKYHLYCNAGPEKSVAATKTFTAQMYLTGLLAAYWGGNEQLLNQLRSLPPLAEKMLAELPEKIGDFVNRFRYIHEGFVLSRGICYPIALEAALKIQETCSIKMKGYAVSDFYHGPIAQIDEDLPVIIFAPKGAASRDTQEMIGKIEKMGIQVLTVTDDAELAAEAAHAVLLPDSGSEVTAAFLFAMFAQYFAQMLSVSKGLNPDSPKLLKKVTITK